MRKLKHIEVNKVLVGGHEVEARFKLREPDPESMFLNDVIYCL